MTTTDMIEYAAPFLRQILDDYRWDTIPILADWLDERGECSRARQLRGRYRKFMAKLVHSRKNWRSPLAWVYWWEAPRIDHEAGQSSRAAAYHMFLVADGLRNWIKQEFPDGRVCPSGTITPNARRSSTGSPLAPKETDHDD